VKGATRVNVVPVGQLTDEFLMVEAHIIKEFLGKLALMP